MKDEVNSPLEDSPFDKYLTTRKSPDLLTKYRPINLALKLLFACYLILPPMVVTIYVALLNNNISLMLLAVVGLLPAGLVILASSFALLLTPKNNEKAAVSKYLWCLGIGIALTLTSRFLGGVWAMDLLKKVAQAYSTYYLIGYFEALAFNFQSFRLADCSHALKQVYVVGLLALIGVMAVSSFFQLPMFAVTTIIAGYCVGFLFHWLRTVWTAMRVTGGYVYPESEA